MKLILDLNTVEPVSGSVADPDTGASRPVAGWLSLMGAITDLAGRHPLAARGIDQSGNDPPSSEKQPMTERQD